MNDLTPRPYSNQLELWKSVVGYENIYEVSNLGHVKRIQGGAGRQVGRVLKPRLDGNGYPYVWLYKNSKRKIWKLHRLVAIAFIGQPPTPDHQVNHINGFRDDPRIENLEWVTPSENRKHAFKIGNACHKGEQSSSAKLTWPQVRDIRHLISEGIRPAKLAPLFGVTISTICSIAVFRTWKE